MSEWRTLVNCIKDRKDGYTEVTLIVDKSREKEVFNKLVNSYRDRNIIVMEVKEDD